MKRFLGATVLLVLTVTSLLSQPALRVVTYPKLPPADILERLNMAQAWTTRLPTGGPRDGLFTLQLIPGKKSTQLVVQTLFGAVFMLDAETGDVLWRTPVGLPGWSGQPVGYNEQNLFVTRRDMLYVLKRSNGAQRYYTVNKETKLPDYGFSLPSPLSAAPSADEEIIFFSMEHRVQAYLLPDWQMIEAPMTSVHAKDLSEQERQALQEKTAILPLLVRWSHHEPGVNFEQPVLFAGADLNAQAVAISTAGNVLSFNKYETSRPVEFQTGGHVSAAAGQHGAMAYIGSEDTILYAFHMINQRVAWRFFASAPILMKPDVTDRDVFVTGERMGLYRVARDTGRAAWLNKQADRFLSTNQKYVYALDRSGLLLILDYARGTTLGQYDMRDWVHSIPNELTDRCYLASNDGQILCLRSRPQTVPVRNRTLEEKLPLKKELKKDDKLSEPKALDKDDDKKGDDAKDMDKAKDKNQP